jgi:hypothetical protein
MANSRDKASRIDIKQRLGLLVRVDFDILVRQPFEFERYPNALNEGTAAR